MARRRDAWRTYAAGSEVDHFARFCKEHLVQSEDRWEGKPLVLEPWQRRMMGEALAFDSDGWPTWRSVVIIAPRKNGKTATLAALSLYRLLTSPGRPEILLSAPSDRVAGRLFDAAARFVRRSEELSNLVRVRDHAGEIVREDGMGIIYRLSSDRHGCTGSTPRTSSSTSSLKREDTRTRRVLSRGWRPPRAPQRRYWWRKPWFASA